MFATKETLAIFTGYKNKSKQIEFLRKLHKNFIINARGEPIIRECDLFNDKPAIKNQPTETANKWQPSFT